MDAPLLQGLPDRLISVRETFDIDSDWQCPAFANANDLVPERDDAYRFDADTTLAILAGFAHNLRVLVQGFHGTGKSTHIEQVAARLNWPCLRINLDAHVSRIDLIGRDAIALREGRQISEFREGILPWALQRNVALVLDEYDAGRPDVMLVLQRVLESQGRLVLLEQNRVLTPHVAFRLFATANTIGLGDATGLYQGTQTLNQGQLDRWQVVATLNYLPAPVEQQIVLARVPASDTAAGREVVARMINVAELTREAFMAGEISTVMSPRTVISWAENMQIFGQVGLAFRLSFLNRCDEAERAAVAELYQRCFGSEVDEADGPTETA
ncbi:MAG TPA: AAA family ATPase [Steroidobacteraceae bacterium]|jgi:cobaltochelatase CobS|nr:AAA family ATPase [Steroidobacteraceae bacterium]